MAPLRVAAPRVAPRAMSLYVRILYERSCWGNAHGPLRCWPCSTARWCFVVDIEERIPDSFPAFFVFHRLDACRLSQAFIPLSFTSLFHVGSHSRPVVWPQRSRVSRKWPKTDEKHHNPYLTISFVLLHSSYADYLHQKHCQDYSINEDGVRCKVEGR